MKTDVSSFSHSVIRGADSQTFLELCSQRPSWSRQSLFSKVNSTRCFFSIKLCCNLSEFRKLIRHFGLLVFYEHDWKVQDNSPGHHAGLEPFFDFIISVGDTRLVGLLQRHRFSRSPSFFPDRTEVFSPARTRTTTLWRSCWVWTWSGPSPCCCTAAGPWRWGRPSSRPAPCGGGTASSGSASASATSRESTKTFGTSWWVQVFCLQGRDVVSDAVRFYFPLLSLSL